MMDVHKCAQEELHQLEGQLAQIEEELKRLPEGALKWQHRHGKLYYYHQFWTSTDQRWGRKYITFENTELAKGLAKKHYYRKLEKLIAKKIHVLRNFTERYPMKSIDEIFDDLCYERKSLVKPIQQTVRTKVENWVKFEYEPNRKHIESLRFETEQGEMVRSKSEVIIANILYSMQEISYQYERPLDLSVNGFVITIHPDFSIINHRTGKVIYWEHLGRMDDPDYVSDAIRKINTYISNGILPGKNLILTFESQGSPLDIRTVRSLAESLYRD